MSPSNTEFILVRNYSGRHTDTVGIFPGDRPPDRKLQFTKTLSTNRGQMDEYEVVTES